VTDTERMVEEAWQRGRHMRDTEVAELRAENERLTKAEGAFLAEVARLRAALEGVLAEADRQTAAFDYAHAVLDGRA